MLKVLIATDFLPESCRNRIFFVTLRQISVHYTSYIMKENIIGREIQIADLEMYMESGRSEFIAIYGRRRIGKTYLVKELFESQLLFRVTGMDNVNTHDQIHNFCHAMNIQFGTNHQAANWIEAFHFLEKEIEKDQNRDVKILFFDELPWFDTRGSNFISALEHFWNDWASYRRDIKLITCGSATTWMLDKVINSRGGLHNRVTHKMLLSPFSLYEVEAYFKSRNFLYEHGEIIDCYMAMGGVAYYLSLFNNNQSVAQNIQRLCFTAGGEMTDEFDKLFQSLFKRADNHIAIVNALKEKGMGMTRLELIEVTKLPNNGNFSRLLNELEQCDFIRSFTPFGKTQKDRMYQLIDPFTLFYFRFMQPKTAYLNNHWIKMQSTPKYQSWAGYAFEIVCLHHINQIVKALGIDGCINIPCSWAYRPTAATIASEEVEEDIRRGAQIDLLIDRSDKAITVCEMKYSNHEYEIDKEYDSHVARRMRIFTKVTKTRKTIIPTYITPYGLYNNMYSRKIPRQVTGDDLFAMA